jgi:hypothetical protein
MNKFLTIKKKVIKIMTERQVYSILYILKKGNLKIEKKERQNIPLYFLFNIYFQHNIY